MPWELEIAASGGGRLGSSRHVQGQLSGVFPDIQTFTQPSGQDRLAAMQEAGRTPPPFIAERLADVPAKAGADLELDGCHVRFLFDAEEVTRVMVEVRGDGDPAPIIQALAAIDGWVLIDDGSLVDPASPDGWQRFRTLADGVLDDER